MKNKDKSKIKNIYFIIDNKIDNFKVNIWKVSNLDTEWNFIDEKNQKLSFLDTILWNKELLFNFFINMLITLDEKKLYKYIKYYKEANFKYTITLEWINDNIVYLLWIISNNSFLKLEVQTDNWKFVNIENWLLMNAIYNYQQNYDVIPDTIYIDFFFKLLLGKVYNNEINNDINSNVLYEQLKGSFLEKTIIK